MVRRAGGRHPRPMDRFLIRLTPTLAFVVGVCTATSAWLLARRDVPTGLVQVAGVLQGAMVVVAVGCLSVGLLLVRRGAGSLASAPGVATLFVAAMTANAVALSTALSFQPQRVLSLVAVLLSIPAATLSALGAQEWLDASLPHGDAAEGSLRVTRPQWPQQ